MSNSTRIDLSALIGATLHAATFRTIGGANRRGTQGHGGTTPVIVSACPAGASIDAQDGRHVAVIPSGARVWEHDGLIWWGSSVTLHRAPCGAHMERAPL